MSARAGFTLAELLIAATIVLVVMAGLAAVVDPSHAASRAQTAATDIRLRLRAASEALAAELEAAGSGPGNGVFGRPLGGIAPAVVPLRLGPRGDPPGTVRSDALTIIAAPRTGAAAELAAAFVPASGVALIAASAGCRAADPACGLGAGQTVAVLDGSGQWDLFTVTAAAGASLGLQPRGAISGRPFPAGSRLVPVNVVCFFLQQGTASEGLQLMTGDADQWELPVVDHLTGLTVEWFGEPTPPRLGSAGRPGVATYGPDPPPPGDDTVADDWPQGENCTFFAFSGGQASRLPGLAPVGTGLVPLPVAMLADGPWCPDGSAANRYDADLLRVRAIRVTLVAEASASMARGADTRLFAHPGSLRDRSGVSADWRTVFDVVPRALQAGR